MVPNYWAFSSHLWTSVNSYCVTAGRESKALIQSKYCWVQKFVYSGYNKEKKEANYTNQTFNVVGFTEVTSLSQILQMVEVYLN